jgi:hypothetical protein
MIPLMLLNNYFLVKQTNELVIFVSSCLGLIMGIIGIVGLVVGYVLLVKLYINQYKLYNSEEIK